MGDAAIGIVTLGILVFWPRSGIRLPGHLPALLAGCAVMGIVNLLAGHVATIGSQFHYVLADGSQGNGIPQLLPQLVLPWDLPNSEFTLTWDLFAHCCLRHSQWQCSAQSNLCSAPWCWMV
ncbi:hypothetical protein ACLK1U_06910 [Escherichia coli]